MPCLLPHTVFTGGSNTAASHTQQSTSRKWQWALALAIIAYLLAPHPATVRYTSRFQTPRLFVENSGLDSDHCSEASLSLFSRVLFPQCSCTWEGGVMSSPRGGLAYMRWAPCVAAFMRRAPGVAFVSIRAAGVRRSIRKYLCGGRQA